MSDRYGPPAGALDSVGMWAAAWGLPEQLEAAIGPARGVDGLPSREDVENVLVLGLGGSGIAGDILTAAAGPFMPVPVVVCKNYNIPAFVGEGTLVFAVSFSGNTEETLEAASIAAGEGARIVCVTRGGELAEQAKGWNAPVIPVADGIPAPRAGLGALSVPPMIVLEDIGLFPGAAQWIALAVEQLRRRRDALQRPGSEIETLAHRIGRTLPLVYGGGGIGYAAAQRWKAQLNENAKIQAYANFQPELCHNEVVGWGQHGDVTRQVLSVVDLRHEYEHPQVARRFDLVDEILDEVVAAVMRVDADGEGQLAQLLDLIFVGDLVSLQLAADAGIDPGPVPVIDQLKAALAGE